MGLQETTRIPEPLRQHLERLCVDEHLPAFLLVSPEGLLLDWGGRPDHYGLKDLAMDRPAVDQVDVLAGLLPLDNVPLHVPYLALPDGRYADLHGVPAPEGDWIIFLDQTAEATGRQTIQQAMNELALLRDRQAHLLQQVRKDREDLRTILDQLDLVTAVIGADRTIEFMSRRGQDLLVAPESRLVGQRWDALLPLAAEERDRLAALMDAPAGERSRIKLDMSIPGGRRYWMEADVRDDPQAPERRLLFLYDVTDVYNLRSMLKEQAGCGQLVGRSPEMLDTYRLLTELSLIDSTVLIDGETGTGKELAARAIHDGSRRSGQPFIVVNCAGLSDSLINSELFGHRRGSFTGATQDQEGVFEAADGGTILLDEIGDVPMNTQTRLLRVLEQREVIRIGETRPRPVDIRIIAATHKDLMEEVRAGRFRKDLLYRIRVARVTMPPLRDRRSDIPLLAETFLGRGAAMTGREVHAVDNEAMRYLLTYTWPGNVRELRNAIEFAVIACRGGVIQRGDLPPEIIQAPPPATPDKPYDLGEEKERILDAIRRTNGNRAEAARLLGISRATLYRRMKACF